MVLFGNANQSKRLPSNKMSGGGGSRLPDGTENLKRLTKMRRVQKSGDFPAHGVQALVVGSEDLFEGFRRLLDKEFLLTVTADFPEPRLLQNMFHCIPANVPG